MKTMFSMGFAPNLFGSRVLNPTLGRLPSRQMGDATVNGDDLLKQLQAAEAQASTVMSFAQAHPNLQQDLGNDYGTWQAYFPTLSDPAIATTEVNVAGELQAVGPGGQYTITTADYTAVQNYIQAAGVLSQIVARHQPMKAPTIQPRPAPGAPAAAAAPAKNDLAVPLLVGGGVLAIGVIALLARG